MATNLALDDKLIEEAVKLSGATSKKDAVNTALLEFIKMKKRQTLIEAKGRIEFDPKYNYKEGRKR